MESLSKSLTTDKELAIYDKIFIAYQDAKRHIRDDLVGCFILLHYIGFDGRFLALFLTFDLRLGLQGTLHSVVLEGNHDCSQAAALAKLQYCPQPQSVSNRFSLAPALYFSFKWYLGRSFVR
jgi:hypothetical protein